MKIELTSDLAKAVIEMDNIGFSEGLGLREDDTYEAWYHLLQLAENEIGQKAFSTRWEEHKKKDACPPV